MEGNSGGKPTDDVQYAVRITFGIVHGVLLTVFSFCLALLFPSLSHFLFELFGCIVAPLISFLLTLFCNGCVEYVSHSTVTATHILKTAWIPPLGVFCCSLLILPLEMMPSLGFHGPITTLVGTSVALNWIITTLLQIYAAKDIQRALPSSNSSSDSPI
jgi:hypothetical protein